MTKMRENFLMISNRIQNFLLFFFPFLFCDKSSKISLDVTLFLPVCILKANWQHHEWLRYINVCICFKCLFYELLRYRNTEIQFSKKEKRDTEIHTYAIYVCFVENHTNLQS